MKNLIFPIVALFLCTPVFAQPFIPADAGSKVHFVIKNFGIRVGGDFTGLKGSILFNPKLISASSFNVSVKSTTVDTDNGAMESHLRKAEFFDADKYPLITLVSTKVTESTVPGRYYFMGNLTIKNVTKKVEFGFSATPAPGGYVFNGEFEIDRRDFGVGGNSFSLSDKVKVSLTVTAKQ